MFLPSVCSNPPAVQMATGRSQQKPIFIQWAIFTTLLLFILPTVTIAAQVSLKWDPKFSNPDGYIVYQRLQGQSYNYNSPAWPADGKKITKTTCTLTGLKEGQTYYFVVRAALGHDISDNSNEVSYKVPVSVVSATTKTQSYTPAAADQNGYYQQNSNGIVSIEAENFPTDAITNTHRWDQVTPSGTSGSGAMKAMPNIGTIIRQRGDTAKSPRLDFTVNFTKSGKYFVWVRGKAALDKGVTGKAATDKNDSLHMGLDGVALASCDRLSGFSSSWCWSNKKMDGAVATIKVNKPGKHTINVWMREDGMIVDKIVLTTSPASVYVPTGLGPDESLLNSNTNTTFSNTSATNTPAIDDPDTKTPVTNASYTAGVISIEAEDYDTDKTTNPHRWDQVTPPGCEGFGAMQAMPDNGRNYSHAGNTSGSPRLDYKVNFTQSGTYYVWVRGKGKPKGRSLHVGLDGVALATADRIAYFPGDDWIWSGTTMDNKARATIKIPKGGEGVHTINVWMREDGMTFDKILLTPSYNYDPNK